MLENIYISKNSNEEGFRNNVDFCVGTGRMGLALREEYMNQLRFVQEEIGFKHIRGHGLFCDDMAIYQFREDEEGNKVLEYNFTYIDRVMDGYLKLGISPFLELGFMPSELASGEKTVFCWKGNITPPKSYERWKALVQSLLIHFIERYGRNTVTKWPIEVWNEPNLEGFWENADMEEYFKLFKETFYAIKEVDESFCVGGPAVCGGTDEVWISSFMSFCRENEIAVDFITRHHYTCGISERKGHYVYPTPDDPQWGRNNLKTTRDIIDSYEEYRGLEIHITEFNTSWYPRNVLHDTNFNAAYIAHQLSWLGDYNESYSYWTFGDVFEETGVPFSLFHGGFGLVADGGIPKPTFWTFKFYKMLKENSERCVHRSDNAVIMTGKNGGFCGIAWNIGENEKETDIHIEFDTADGEYVFIRRTVDKKVCNPLKVWHDIGEPKNVTAAERELIKRSAYPFIETERITAAEGKAEIDIEVNPCGVVYFELNPSEITSDRGYDYESVIAESTLGRK